MKQAIAGSVSLKVRFIGRVSPCNSRCVVCLDSQVCGGQHILLLGAFAPVQLFPSQTKLHKSILTYKHVYMKNCIEGTSLSALQGQVKQGLETWQVCAQLRWEAGQLQVSRLNGTTDTVRPESLIN